MKPLFQWVEEYRFKLVWGTDFHLQYILCCRISRDNPTLVRCVQTMTIHWSPMIAFPLPCFSVSSLFFNLYGLKFYCSVSLGVHSSRVQALLQSFSGMQSFRDFLGDGAGYACFCFWIDAARCLYVAGNVSRRSHLLHLLFFFFAYA